MNVRIQCRYSFSHDFDARIPNKTVPRLDLSAGVNEVMYV